MRVGIVGAEEQKFTELGERRAKDAIREIFSEWNLVSYLSPTTLAHDYVVSGHCHLGGIDIWTEELANERGLRTRIYPPKVHNWSEGYRPRNLRIVENSDIVYCITIDKLPPDYIGMKFKTCYHCARFRPGCESHVKSGGCWTAIQAIKSGKEARWIRIEND